MHPSQARARGSVHGLDDPEYLALMREWEAADVPTIVRVNTPKQVPATRPKIVTILGALGALGAVAIVTWGIRHLRVVK